MQLRIVSGASDCRKPTLRICSRRCGSLPPEWGNSDYADLKELSLGVGALTLTRSRAVNLQAAPLGLPIGLELYTVRDDCAKDLEGTLRKVAQIGYKEVEMYAPFFGRRASEVGRTLYQYGLTCPSAHWEVAKTPSEWQKQVEDAREIGLKYMISGIPLSKPATLDDSCLSGCFSKPLWVVFLWWLQFRTSRSW